MIKKILISFALSLLALKAFAANPNDLMSTETPKEQSSLADELGLADLLKNQTQPLAATDAFKLNLSTTNNQFIKADWKVVEGHYIYQGKIKLDIIDPTTGLTLNALNLPSGKNEVDPFFGDVTTYNKDFSVTAKVNGERALLEKDITLKASYQGCSKITGICYPPQHETLKLSFTPDQLASSSAFTALATTDNSVAKTEAKTATPETMAKDEIATNKVVAEKATMDSPVALMQEPTLPVDSAPASDAPTSSPIQKSNLTSQFEELKADDDEPMHPDQAFVLDVTSPDNQTINARWDIVPGHYLYQHKIKFAVVDGKEGVSFAKPIIPEGKKEHDEYFGDIVTYNESFDVQVPLLGNPAGDLEEVTVKTSYQGCSKCHCNY